MQQRSEETRAQILEAALDLFSHAGYDATSVDAVCAQAGVSKGAFYHHFPSKQAVFLQLLENWLAVLDASFAAARDESENVAQIFVNMSATIPSIIEEANQHLPMFLEFWAHASRDEAVWQATIAPYRRYRDFFSEIIDQGIAEGVFRPVDAQIAAQLIVSLAVGTLLQGLLDPQDTNWQQAASESMKLMMKGLAVEAQEKL